MKSGSSPFEGGRGMFVKLGDIDKIGILIRLRIFQNRLHELSFRLHVFEIQTISSHNSSATFLNC